VHRRGLSHPCAARALGRNVRTLFQLQYHLAMSHALPQLKLVCPLDVMTEWEEMLWGILRRWSVQTCNKAPGTMCVNAIVRTHFRREVLEHYGTREEFSGAAYRGTGPLPTQYRQSGFEDADKEDLVLGATYLENKNFPAYIQNIAEYLENGRWHKIGYTEGEDEDEPYTAGEDNARTLTILCGDSSRNWADPAPLNCSTHSLADVRRISEEALKAYSEKNLSVHERAIVLSRNASMEVQSGG
jgi:hypothetical protein